MRKMKVSLNFIANIHIYMLMAQFKGDNKMEKH